jgi:hypothetical protein
MTWISRRTDLTITEQPAYTGVLFWRERALDIPRDEGDGGAAKRRRVRGYAATWVTAGLIVAGGSALGVNPYLTAGVWLAVGALGWLLLGRRANRMRMKRKQSPAVQP